MSLRKIKDQISPDLLKKAKAMRPDGRKRLLSAMGQAVKSMGVRAFTQPGLRAAAWSPRKDQKKTHALLQLTTTLRKSIRVTSLTSDRVNVGSDRPYAAVHQLGSKKQNIPARPYLPFYKSGKLTKLGATGVERALKAGLKSAGL